MPSSLPNSACPPRKAKTPQGPKSRNIVDVEKLKSSNENQEPGIEKKNVKFLYGLLEQASNEREQLMKQLADHNETIEMISQQRHLEEIAFRKVLTTERKKFDKKILDARNMLQRREDLLCLWSEIGITAGRKYAETEDEDSGQEHAKIVALLKRTCRILPEALDAAQKEEFNIVNESNGRNARNDKEEEEGDDDEEDEGKDTHQDDEEFGNDEFEYANEEHENEHHDMDENSIGGHTMSGSILMGESREKGKQPKTNNKNKGKVDNRLNIGSGILEGNQPAHLKSMSISDMVADDGINQILHKNDSDSLQFQTLSHISANNDHDKSKVKGSTSSSPKKVTGSSGVSSSSYHEHSHHSRAQEEEQRRKKNTAASSSSSTSANKKFESASLDLSDTSNRKFWWDHLVDDNSDEKGKEENTATAGLMLGSGLDKGDREKESKGESHQNKKNNEIEIEDKAEEQNNDDSSVNGGGGSVVSLCSDDFKFSTTSM